MNSLLSKIRDKHALWYKGMVFALSVILCTYLLPKDEVIVHYKIQTGDVWLYEDLVSTIDFVVKKSEQELNQEAQSNKLNEAYYRKTDGNSETIINTFKKQFNTQQVQKLKQLLDSIYQIGVYVPSSNLSTQNSTMYVVIDNEVTTTTSSQFINQQHIKSLLTNIIPRKELVDSVYSLIQANVVYDELLSAELDEEKTEAKYIFKTKLNKGDVIVYKNDIVSEEQFQAITSYQDALQEVSSQRSQTLIIAGQFLVCTIVMGIMMLFLAFFRKPIFSQNTQVTFIFMNIMMVIVVASLVATYRENYIYAVPFCLLPILIRVFFDSRTSLFTFLNIVLITAFYTEDKFEFIFIQLIAGISTIFSVADMGKRSKLFTSALLTFIFYILAFIAYNLVNNTASAIYVKQNYINFLISSSCVLFAFPLILISEKLFGFVSDFTLLELCDLNSPLLRQLSQKVPGTFQHSLQVANLAEEACYKIGGNPLLVRTGAMYHDIGKMNHPRFFTENQVGEISPHEDLQPEESAQIIINHVIEGIEIAKVNKLPEVIIDFIRTHHGTTLTRYFLHNYKKEHEGEKINEDLFRYPGPIPYSKETAILMMADGVEASSRSLKKYDAVSIDELVDRIINHQIDENQFINSDITFRDIKEIKKIFKKRLMNIYHVRIEYPRV